MNHGPNKVELREETRARNKPLGSIVATHAGGEPQIAFVIGASQDMESKTTCFLFDFKPHIMRR